MTATTTIDISNLDIAMKEVTRAWKENSKEPVIDSDLKKRIERIRQASLKMPIAYNNRVLTNLINHIQNAYAANATTPQIDQYHQELEQIYVQRDINYQFDNLTALQEFCADIYMCFLSDALRHKVAKPQGLKFPPLALFGDPTLGPATFYAAPVKGSPPAWVTLPPSSAQQDLLSWVALGHEVAGHDILHAYDLISDMQKAVNDALADPVKNRLASSSEFTHDELILLSNLRMYWSARIDEAVSDIMGLLNVGPAAGIGLLGYFRGLRASQGKGNKLSNTIDIRDPHPTDLWRVYLWAETLGQLPFASASEWRTVLLNEAKKDCTNASPISKPAQNELDNAKISNWDGIDQIKVIKKSAEAFAKIILTTPWDKLNKKRLTDIYAWSDSDEKIVQQIIPLIRQKDRPALAIDRDLRAAHICAAATLAAIGQGGELQTCYSNMIMYLHELVPRDIRLRWYSPPPIEPSPLSPTGAPIMLEGQFLAPHIVYPAAGQSAHEVWYSPQDNRWFHVDLTNQHKLAARGSLHAYSYEAATSLAITYAGGPNQDELYQLMLRFGERPLVLIGKALSNHPPQGQVVGFQGPGAWRSAVFLSKLGDIFHLQQGERSWSSSNVSATLRSKSSQPPAVAAGDPIAWSPKEGVFHVVYRDTKGHIIHLQRDANAKVRDWVYVDRTAAGAGSSAAGDPVLCPSTDGRWAIFYVDSDGRIESLTWDAMNAGPTTVKMWTRSHNLPLATGKPSICWHNKTRTWHMVYRNKDSHVIEVWWNQHRTHHADLTAITNSQPKGNAMITAKADPSLAYTNNGDYRYLAFWGSDDKLHCLRAR
ncbi:MAG TPA: hypothetical protein DCQ33_14205 [Nitrospira sp.]|nr:hypothetical protein [Nitrospira sp.]